jgi:hypothetical protein
MMRLVFLTLILLGFASGTAAGAGAAATTKSAANSTGVVQPGTNAAMPLYVNSKCVSGCYAEDHRSFLSKIWTDPIAVFTVVLAVSTIGFWVVTGPWRARRSARSWTLKSRFSTVVTVTPE